MAASRAFAQTMTPELWQRLKPLFHAVMEREADARASFVDEICGADAELKGHLLLLVRGGEKSTDLLDQPLVNLRAMPTSEASRFQVGEVILGRFRVVRLLGKGGMGEVFEAEDLQLGRIALKTIRSEVALSFQGFERFRQEVQLARKVSGLQVCRIHELFLLPATGGHPPTAFLTMEFLDGITLAVKLDHDGRLPWKEALPLVLDICDALMLIHEQGIVHRDLKSSNIMLCMRSGKATAVVMDFGLARDAAFDSAASEEKTISVVGQRTLPGTLAGTPAYMAPEQFDGRSVSPATDIYALGVVLYELVTGIHPYAAPTPMEAAIRRAKRPALASSIERTIPRHWDRLIERCLEYEPGQRFQTSAEMAKALKASPASFANLRKDRPWVISLAGVLILAALTWGSLAWWQWFQYNRPNAEARRWYDVGLAALREGSYLRATNALDKATAQDSHFVMAHARLAEAWSNLDFDGNAQREMLVATSGEPHVPPMDRLYLVAVRDTLTRDDNGALAAYRQILHRLPDSGMPAGYVDLGMAYERVGDPSKALESYAHAAQLDSANPAPEMHIAVLNSRLHNIPAAQHAFSQAETLFRAEINLEGLAELDYQRGYLANEREDSEEANIYLNRALSEAKQLPSVQLEIRTLTQLSSVALNSDHAKEAIELAQRGIRLARENRLDAWAANGLARLANAEFIQGHFQDAEGPVQEALQLARQSQQPRVEALANLVLASLRNLEGRPDEVLAPAQAAFVYYKQNGHFEPAAKASVLLTRNLMNKGHLADALQSAKTLQGLVAGSGSRDLVTDAEESIGMVLLEMEQFPEALEHFKKSWATANTLSARSYEAIYCADALQKLGRFAEANVMLISVPKTDRLALGAAEIQGESLLNQQRYAEVERLAMAVTGSHPALTADLKQTFLLDLAISEAHLGKKTLARSHLRAVSDSNELEKDPSDKADTQLRAAEVNLLTGNVSEAYRDAKEAQAYFASSGKFDSELHSACWAAAASNALHDKAGFVAESRNAVDILTHLKQTWDAQTIRTYLSRPDLRKFRSAIPLL